jgi:hypothetical protein
MASTDSFGAKGTLEVGDRSYQIYRLSAVTGDGLPDGAVELTLWHADQLTEQPVVRLQVAGAASPNVQLNFVPRRRRN